MFSARAGATASRYKLAQRTTPVAANCIFRILISSSLALNGQYCLLGRSTHLLAKQLPHVCTQMREARCLHHLLDSARCPPVPLPRSVYVDDLAHSSWMAA